jgi:hypothetical protein
MRLKSTAIAGTLVTAFAVASCGGGGSGGGSTPLPQNTMPAVSALASTSVNQDTPTAPIAFTLADNGGPDVLTLTAISSSNAIVQPEGIAFAGTGANRTLTVTPAEDATGSVNITVQAQDLQGLIGTSSFTLTVNAVQQSILNYTNTTFAQGENDTPAQVSGFTFTQDADAETTFDPLLR